MVKTPSILSAVIAGFLLASGMAMAGPSNEGPPAGPVIVDLDGTPVPTEAYRHYAVMFVASGPVTDLTLALRDDPGTLFLDNVSLTTGGGANLVINGGFESGPLWSHQPEGWTYSNPFGAQWPGLVFPGCGVGGSNCYFDGATQGYDQISQSIATTTGATYLLGFDLVESVDPPFFSALSTNGDVTGPDGNGMNVVVYAEHTGEVVRVPVPVPSSLALLSAGLVCIGFIRSLRRQARLLVLRVS